MRIGWKASALAVAAALAAAAVAEDNLDYWLGQATTAPATAAASQPAPATAPSRPDALPAAVRLSDGTLLAGGVCTTGGADLVVWIDPQQRWRHVPLVILRSIEAVVISEGLQPEWRWAGTGIDEKVYTGRTRPIRRLAWTLRLIDGTSLTGEITGQPLWLQRDGGRMMLVLHARQKGDWGETLDDLPYPAHIVFSQREMERIADLPEGTRGRMGPP
ncbi:MAG: hypothetical protein GX591_08340 [Planctomycetes bacterium]|nr:hypothetical protein [Planctomycetota bacterium]